MPQEGLTYDQLIDSIVAEEEEIVKNWETGDHSIKPVYLFDDNDFIDV